MQASHEMRWLPITFSTLATQACAIAFLPTSGQASNDRMGFVEFYFGLPVATVVVRITAVPRGHLREAPVRALHQLVPPGRASGGRRCRSSGAAPPAPTPPR